jgi:predicted transglutaminase-like cysteine proteinase
VAVRCFLVTIVAMTMLASGPASASGRNGRLAAIPPSTSMEPLKEARAPIGWVEFCARNAGQCDAEALPARDLAMTATNWRLLNRVNDAVNDAIEPITDLAHWGVVERWDYPTDGKGDCEDFVLEKQRRLISLGVPRQALLIAVVRDRKGDGHAVLLVKTDRGDYVLDNQEDNILSWAETGYGFVKRQSQEDPNRWVGLGEPRPNLVAVGNTPPQR